MSLDKISQLKESAHNSKNEVAASMSPQQTELRIEYNEAHRLPFRLIKLAAYIELMIKKFGMQPDERSRSALSRFSGDLSELSVNQFNEMIPFTLTFENGLLIHSANEQPIPILRYIADERSSLVAVSSTDAAARKVFDSVYEETYKLAGIKKNLAEMCIHATSFGTSSIERLNFGLKSVFSPEFNKALEGTLQSDSPVFKKVGAVQASGEAGEQADALKLVVKVQEVELRIQKVNLQSGMSETCRLIIRPRTHSDVGLGDYIVISEYDNRTHALFVEELSSALASDR